MGNYKFSLHGAPHNLPTLVYTGSFEMFSRCEIYSLLSSKQAFTKSHRYPEISVSPFREDIKSINSLSLSAVSKMTKDFNFVRNSVLQEL